ncbi:PQQ-binding-like beta-propeller repeat protein, partial [Halolamina litorea]
VDADADGATELLVATDGGRLTAFEGNGSVAWQRTDVGRVLWSSAGTVANETVFATATAGGQVGLFDAATGERRWQHDFGRYAAVNAIGDGDGDGTAEVYAVARDGELRAIDGASGDVEWTTTLTGADVQMTPPPTLGDVDGDGSEELVAVTNDGLVSLVDPTDGSVLSTHERNVPIYTYPSVVDTDDDGAAEVYVIYSDGRVVAFEGTE